MKTAAYFRISVTMLIFILLIFILLIFSRIDYNLLLTFKIPIIAIFTLMFISLIIDSTIYNYYISGSVSMFIFRTLISIFAMPFAQFYIIFDEADRTLNKKLISDIN